MGYQYYIELASIIVTVFFLFDSFRIRHFSMESTKLMRVILVVSTFSATLNILTLNAAEGTIIVPVAIEYIFCYSFFILEGAIPMLIFCYVLIICKRLNEMSFGRFFVRMIPLLAYYLLLFANIFTDWLFSFDLFGNFNKGPLYTISYYALVLCYLALSVGYVLKYKERLRKQEKVIILEFVFIAILTTIVQLFNPNLLLIGFAFLLCNAVIYFNLEKPSAYVDDETKLLNNAAYYKYDQTRRIERKPYTAVIIHFRDFAEIYDLLGYNLGGIFLATVSKVISKNFPNNLAFRLEREELAIIDTKNKNQEIVAKLIGIFDRPWKINGTEITLNPIFLIMNYPEHFTDMKSQRKVIDYLKEKSRQDNTSRTFMCNAETIKSINYSLEVDKAIVRAIQNDSFQVYYQPIYDIKKGKMYSAEALIRLFDEKLGFISPKDLIANAEKSGYIVKVGEIVFEKVCQFIKDCLLTNEILLTQINVNLSSIQCVQDDLSDRFIRIADKYNVPYNMINLELTESALISLKLRLKKHMTIMSQKGFSFSCDDYGTGFSTCSYILEFPFSEVKFDKSLIDNFSINPKTKVIVNSELVATKGLNMRSVAEGVETLEQLEMVKESGFDYVQGYYYSKPIPKEQFVEYCKKNA